MVDGEAGDGVVVSVGAGVVVDEPLFDIEPLLFDMPPLVPLPIEPLLGVPVEPLLMEPLLIDELLPIEPLPDAIGVEPGFVACCWFNCAVVASSEEFEDAVEECELMWR